jgi:hypothetical protein
LSLLEEDIVSVPFGSTQNIGRWHILQLEFKWLSKILGNSSAFEAMGTQMASFAFLELHIAPVQLKYGVRKSGRTNIVATPQMANTNQLKVFKKHLGICMDTRKPNKGFFIFGTECTFIPFQQCSSQSNGRVLSEQEWWLGLIPGLYL